MSAGHLCGTGNPLKSESIALWSWDGAAIQIRHGGELSAPDAISSGES